MRYALFHPLAHLFIDHKTDPLPEWDRVLLGMHTDEPAPVILRRYVRLPRPTGRDVGAEEARALLDPAQRFAHETCGDAVAA